MKKQMVLSLDIETTGLEEDCKMIEFACVPIDIANDKVYMEHGFEALIKCPSFEELKPSLNQFVIENNEAVITEAHEKGISEDLFKQQLETYLNSKEMLDLFGNKPKVIFGKSLSALDLPVLTRYLSWNFMRKEFHHRTRDLSEVAQVAIDLGLLPEECSGSSALAKLVQGKVDVDHRAMSDNLFTFEAFKYIMNLIASNLVKKD